MHPHVRTIFDEHAAWLKDGGNEAIEAVRQANWAAVIDRHLKMVEQELLALVARRAARGGFTRQWLAVLGAYQEAERPQSPVGQPQAQPRPQQPAEEAVGLGYPEPVAEPGPGEGRPKQRDGADQQDQRGDRHRAEEQGRQPQEEQ